MVESTKSVNNVVLSDGAPEISVTLSMIPVKRLVLSTVAVNNDVFSLGASDINVVWSTKQGIGIMSVPVALK